jgi:adenylosuccinate synthase
MKDFIPEIITFITTTIAGIGAWNYERNKRRVDLKNRDLELAKLKSELEKSQTDNDKNIIELYQDALNDLKARYDNDIKELEERFAKKFDEMEARYNRLKKSFDDYKAKHK